MKNKKAPTFSMNNIEALALGEGTETTWNCVGTIGKSFTNYN